VNRCADTEDVFHPFSHPADLDVVAPRWLGQAQAVMADAQDAESLAAVVSHREHDPAPLDAVVTATAVVCGGNALGNVPAQTPQTWRDISAEGLWNLGAHNSAKDAVVALTTGLAADLPGTGVIWTTVSATTVSAGSTRTPMPSQTGVLHGLERAREQRARHLAGWLPEPGTVAAAICRPCCEQPSARTPSAPHTDGGLRT
jgi:hypothetical protein